MGFTSDSAGTGLPASEGIRTASFGRNGVLHNDLGTLLAAGSASSTTSSVSVTYEALLCNAAAIARVSSASVCSPRSVVSDGIGLGSGWIGLGSGGTGLDSGENCSADSTSGERCPTSKSYSGTRASGTASGVLMGVKGGVLGCRAPIGGVAGSGSTVLGAGIRITGMGVDISGNGELHNDGFMLGIGVASVASIDSLGTAA